MSEDISKLPKWAQRRFEVLTRQRDEAQAALRRLEENAPSPISYDSYSGERVPRVAYVPSRQVEIRHAGVRLRVITVDAMRGNPPELRLMFDPEKDIRHAVGIFPSASNAAILRSVPRS